MRGALQAAREKTPPQARMLFSPALEKALGEIQELIAAQASARGLPARYAAEKLLEGDARTEAQLELNAAARQAVAEAAKRAERRLHEASSASGEHALSFRGGGAGQSPTEGQGAAKGEISFSR